MRWMGTLAILCALACLFISLGRGDAMALAGKSGNAPADTTKEQKTRVRKETAPPVKGDDQTAETVMVVEDEDEDFFSACIGGCLGEFLGAMLGSICGGSSPEGDVEPVAGQDGELSVVAIPPARLSEGNGQELPFLGIVTAADMNAEGVEIWDRPGGAAAGGSVLRALAVGVTVNVTKLELHADEPWLRVEGAEPEAFDGWLRDSEIIRPAAQPIDAEAAGEEYAESSVAPASAGNAQESYASPGEEPTWFLRADISYPVFTSEEISEEYEDDCWDAGFKTGLFLTRSLNVGFLFSYLHADGIPLYKYEGETTTDWPLASDLDIMNFGAHVGQLFAMRDAYFMYGVGPSIFSVKESASIGIYEGETRVGTRTDELSEWKFGASVEIGTGWLAGGRVPIGVSGRYSWIPWEGSEEESLTLDYLGEKDIHIFSFGISIGYLFF